MPRSARSSKLETRTARLAIKQKKAGERHFVTIGEGLALGYRRTEAGYGTWQSRLWDGSRYHYNNLGVADDYQDENGVDVLTFYQAQDAARKIADESKANAGVVIKPMTVAEVAGRYMKWFREHRKSVRETQNAIDTHIAPSLGKKLLSELTAPVIREWLYDLATGPARVRTSRFSKSVNRRTAAKTHDERRARRATANRVFASLKAMLNMAFREGRIASDAEWRKVKPFEKVEEARIRFLTDAEATRLVNACPPDMRQLVSAALLTGARFGEITTMLVKDVNLDTAQVYVSAGKSGRGRYVPLNAEGVALYRAALAGKVGDEIVFTKSAGAVWGKNHHVRPLAEACKIAKIKPGIAFHELRHTYASYLAQAGVDLLTISKLIGHADTRITSKHYAHLADKTLADAVTKLPSFETPGTTLTVVKTETTRQRAATKK